MLPLLLHCPDIYLKPTFLGTAGREWVVSEHIVKKPEKKYAPPHLLTFSVCAWGETGVEGGRQQNELFYSTLETYTFME